ncbi:unnamed protein product [Zymoseptoria tritici ST99CH_3D1]|nr:unnamed protein product [Zymoseptoria tritici ST99CH_3D1]
MDHIKKPKSNIYRMISICSDVDQGQLKADCMKAVVENGGSVILEYVMLCGFLFEMPESTANPLDDQMEPYVGKIESKELKLREEAK